MSVGSCCFASTVDTAILHAPIDDQDRLQKYHYSLLAAALEASVQKYGQYSFRQAEKPLPRDRQFADVIKGKHLTVMVSPPMKKWEGKALRVPFPVQKGVSSFRIFLITKKNKDLLASIKTLDALKKIPTGTNQAWSTTIILNHHKFNVVAGLGYKNLFEMLERGRFDTFNRGINEIPIELEEFTPSIPSLTYDKHVVLYTYLPNYYYVSPTQPKLAERIEYGLLELHESGALDKIFNNFYGKYLAQFELNKRLFFSIENINLQAGMYEHDKPYLYMPQSLYVQ